MGCLNKKKLFWLKNSKMPSKSDSSYSEGSLLQHRENNSRTSLSSDGIISVETLSTASGLSVDETLKKRDLTPIKELGAGQFAKVYLADKQGMSKQVAIKVFDLVNPTNIKWIKNCLSREMLISEKLKHPNIIYTLDVFKTKTIGVIVMEFASNGTIKNELYNTVAKPFNEKQSRDYLKGLMSGLQHMHDRNIAHRDLKLENFLLSSQKVPKISDFGFSTRGASSAMIQTSLFKTTLCGTPGYMAPELINLTKKQRYDAKAVDIYSMGINLYEMLHMRLPLELFKDKTGSITFNSNITNSAKTLIKNMLNLNPASRPKTNNVLNDSWVTNSLLNLFG